MIRVLFDMRRPGWAAYGRVLFVESADQAQAAAQAEAGEGAIVSRLEVRPAKPGEYERYLDLQERRKRWLRNVEAGVPNPHDLL